MDEFNASLVRLHPYVFDDLVDQVVLSVSEPAHCFSLWRIVRASLGELDAARCEKVANAVEARLSIDMEPIISGGIKGAKCFASLGCTLLKVFVEHLFPTRRMDAGGIRDHTVEVEQNGVVLVTSDNALNFGLQHRSFLYNPVL
jgi:hypothetical protein